MLKTSLGSSEYQEKGKLLLSRTLALTFVCLGIASLVGFAFTTDRHMSWALLIATFVVIPAYFLVERDFIRSATFLQCILVFSLTWYAIAFRIGTIRTPAIGFFIVIAPLALLLLSKAEAIFINALMFFSIIALFILEQNGLIGNGPESTVADLVTIMLLGALMLVSFFLTLHWGMLKQEVALKEIESQYKRLFDNIPIGLYRTTLDGHQLRANPTLWQLEGYSSEEESLADSFDIGDEWYVDKDRRADFVKEIETFGKVVNFESQIYHRKSGDKIWISESAYPVLDSKGKVLFYEGSVQDITQRKEAEAKILERAAALKQLSDDYQTVTDAARSAIVKTDVAGTITFANLTTKKLFGYEPEEVVGKNIELLIDESERERFWRKIVKQVKRPSSATDVSGYQAKGVRKSGEEVWVDIILSDGVDADGQIVYRGIIRDVTEQTKTAEFLNHMQRLDSLGMLAGGVAHDFNNLLVSIMGQTSLALHKMQEDDPARDHLLKAKAAGQQAAGLCRQLLAYSGKGHFEIQAISLNKLIAENISLHKIAIPSTVELKTNYDDQLPMIKGDQAQIQQIIMNLLINAADAIGNQAGKITLSTECKLVRGKDSLLWTRSGTPLKPGEYAILHVADNGRGMSPETLDRIFEPFFTTRDSGNGLGLSAVQGIVRGHKGSMLVHSSLGKGSTFSIYFPALVAEKQPVKQKEAVINQQASLGKMPPLINKPINSNGSAHSDNRPLILVIDDQEDVRRTFCDMLKLFGFQVLEATDGNRGIEVYRANRADIRLVLLDYKMPGLSGNDTLDRLRQIDQDVPIIMCSGFADGSLPGQDKEEHALEFLKKPFTADELQRLVKKHIG